MRVLAALSVLIPNSFNLSNNIAIFCSWVEIGDLLVDGNASAIITEFFNTINQNKSISDTERVLFKRTTHNSSMYISATMNHGIIDNQFDI